VREWKGVREGVEGCEGGSHINVLRLVTLGVLYALRLVTWGVLYALRLVTLGVLYALRLVTLGVLYALRLVTLGVLYVLQLHTLNTAMESEPENWDKNGISAVLLGVKGLLVEDLEMAKGGATVLSEKARDELAANNHDLQVGGGGGGSGGGGGGGGEHDDDIP